MSPRSFVSNPLFHSYMSWICGESVLGRLDIGMKRVEGGFL